MVVYKAPLNDMRFLLKTMGHDLKAMDRDETVDPGEAAVLESVLTQAARFVEEQLAPINSVADRTGCRFADGKVSLPAAMVKAYARYVEAGWMGVNLPETWGGQNLPASIGAFTGEMLSSANPAFSMIPALTMSACKAIIAFGSNEIKQQYLPCLASGEWTGTMCMTEAHCGSDLGLIRTSAIALGETHYAISGTKIFISAGEQNLERNIIHLVLARIKGAVDGVKGLSLFLVPKLRPDTGLPNTVSCIGLEEKMGIHANPTCTMSFEAATGYLIGRPNEGIKAMFTMMNEMRLGTALQGVGLSECAFQKSYHYAMERTQGKTLNKAAQTPQAADPLIQHTDVRRMLLTQKAFAEGGRALCHYCANLLDRPLSSSEIATDSNASSVRGPDHRSNRDAVEKAKAEKLLGLLTPIAKAFLTETGLESAKDAIQVYGGHGYIRDSGVEQLYRDGRIATLYEGTTGIQALDLLGRKVLGDQGQTLLLFTKEIHTLCQQIESREGVADDLKALALTLKPYAKEWPQLSQQIGMKALQDHEEVGAAAMDYLMYSGYVTLGFFWLQMAGAASTPNSGFSGPFLAAKMKVAQFYFAKLLPRTQSHKLAMSAGKGCVSSLAQDEWMA